MLLQAYDFLQLFERHGCTLQVGGSDQWGNITAGVELIRRVAERVAPTRWSSRWSPTPNGVKLGKTEQGAVWLDAAEDLALPVLPVLAQPADADVIQYLKYFTWLGREEIEALAQAVAERPQERARRNAPWRSESTRMVHGEQALAAGRAGVASALRRRGRGADRRRHRGHLRRCARRASCRKPRSRATASRW